MPDFQDTRPTSVGLDHVTPRRPRLSFHVSILQLFVVLTVTAILVWSNLLMFRQGDKVDDAIGLRLITFTSGWPFRVSRIYGVLPIEEAAEVSPELDKKLQNRNINWLALVANVGAGLVSLVLILGSLRFLNYRYAKSFFSSMSRSH